MGHVYLALDPNIDRKVAVKVFVPLLKVGVAERWELRQRFVLEARAAGRLHHPGIVTIFDADTDPDTGLSYLAMEWVDGPSLDDLIRESGPLSIQRSMAIVEEVAEALEVAHRQGLVHRDIKPANILLENSGRAKVTDFGIAKLASMSITSTGWIPGSPFYMSPEQIRNENIDRRSDLYALGAVLYQCLTGTLPFEAESLAALTHMILEIDPRPVRAVNPEVGADLAAVIDRAMAKSPDERFDSGGEFAEALRQVRAGKFAPAAGGAHRAGARAARAASPEGLGEGGGGTIGLAAASAEPRPEADPAEPPEAAEPGQQADPADPLEPDEPRLAAKPEAASSDPGDLAEPPAGRETSSLSGVGRVALAAGLLLVLVGVWSLRPVQSEPASGSTAVARLFSLTPRFAADAPGAGAELDVPAQPPLDSEAPSAVQPTAPEEPFRPASPAAATGPPRPAAARSTVPAASPARPSPQAAAPAGDAEAAPVEPPAAYSLPETAAPPPPVPRKTSALELVYRNRIKNAVLSVVVDGQQVYSGSVTRSPGLFNRAVGKNVWASVALTPGEHVVDVRVTGETGKLDLVRQVTATFEEGRTHRLRISVTRFRSLKLSWKDSPFD